MARFLGLYGGDILVSILVLAGVVSVVRGMVRDRRAGKSPCAGCSGCGGCAGCGMCHGGKSPE